MNTYTFKYWQQNETFRLCELLLKHGKDYSLLSEHMPGRSQNAIRQRMLEIAKNPGILKDKHRDALEMMKPSIKMLSNCSRWTKEEYDLLMNHLRHYGKSEKLLFKLNLPGRSLQSVKHKVCEILRKPQKIETKRADVIQTLQGQTPFLKSLKANEWLDKEQIKLLELIKLHGLDYPKLCLSLQRSYSSVKTKVHLLARDRHLIGKEYSDVRKLVEHLHWTMDDYERLIDGLEECVNEKENGYQMNSKPSGAQKEVQMKSELQRKWQKISKMVGTKTPQQCMEEYEKLLGDEEQIKPIALTKRPNGAQQL